MPALSTAADAGTLPDRSHERHTWWVLATAAAVGFVVGAFVYPMWTDNVESAQVQAHVVVYGPSDVMGVYHSSVYSIVIQTAAVLIRAGVAEWPLSLLFSGLQAALSCGALAMFTLAISRSGVAALLVPVLLLRFRTTIPDWPGFDLAVYHGHHYPNLFPDHTSIYGIVGLFWIMLVFALFSLSKRRTAAVLLGLTPAVHVGLAPAAAIGALAAARWLYPSRREILRFLAIGLAVSAATALWHVTFHWGTPTDVSPADIDRIASSFERHWDNHNALLGSSGWGSFFESEFYTLFLALSLLTYLRRYLPDAARIIVIATTSIALVAIGYTLAVNLRPDLANWRIESLMITRWLNLSSFAFPVLALGLLAQLTFCERDLVAAAALTLASAVVFTGYAASITGASSIVASRGHEIGTLHACIFPLAIVLPSCVLALLRSLEAARPEGRAYTVTYPQAWATPLKLVAVIACVVSLLVNHIGRISAERFRGRDGFTRALDELRNGRGLVAVGDGLWTAGRLQLRTRRPLLLDPTQINLLLKVPSAGPRMVHILDRVYGVKDFDAGQPVLDRDWPRQPPEFWREIGREFGVTDVLVRGDITLQLPKRYGDANLAIYGIPDN